MMETAYATRNPDKALSNLQLIEQLKMHLHQEIPSPACRPSASRQHL